MTPSNYSAFRLRRQRKFRSSLFETLEVRHMMAEDTARQILSDVNAAAPTITSVSVSSPTFKSRFAQHLVSSGLGSQGGFLNVGTAAPQGLGWSVNGIRLGFSQDVDVVMEDLHLAGVRNSTIQPTSFNYNAATREATWYFPEVSNERLAVTTSNYIQSKLSGKFLDATSSDTDPSSSLMVRLDVLAGDMNRDGLVTLSDYNNIRDTLFSSIGSPNYNIFNDANADGLISVSDGNPIRASLFSSRGSRLPTDIRPQLLPGISRLAIGDLLEDADVQSLVFATNTSTGNLGAEGTFTLQATSSNQNLISNAGMAIQSQVGYHQLRFRSAPDQFGSTNIAVSIGDLAGMSASSLSVQVLPVNDAPVVSTALGRVVLIQPESERTIDLKGSFSDVDDANLSYRVVSASSDSFTATISSSLLTIRAVNGQFGRGQLWLEATDAAGLWVRQALDVEVAPNLDAIQYAYVSDQVIANQGQNSLELVTNFDQSERIAITSTDEQVIRASDVSIQSLGSGRHRVIVKHRTSDYGVTSLSFRVGDTLLSNLMVLVLPAANATQTDFGDIKVAYQRQVTEQQTTILTRTFNARYLATQVQKQLVTPETFFSIARPVNPFDTLVTSAIRGATFTQKREPPTPGSGVLQTGRIELSYEIPQLQTEHLDQKLLTPSQERVRDIFIGNLGEELNSAFNPFENPFVLASYAKFTIGAGASFNPATVGLAWKLLPEATGELALLALGAVSKAVINTKYEANPELLGTSADGQELALNMVDLLFSAGGIRDAYKNLIKVGTSASSATQGVLAVVELYSEYFQIPLNLVANHKTHLDTQQYGEMIRFLKLSEEFTSEALSELNLSVAEFVQRADPNDPDLQRLLTTSEEAKAALQEIAQAMATSAEELKKQSESDESTAINVTESDIRALPAEDEATKEKSDENGSKQSQIVDLMKKAGLKPREGLITAIGIGKQVVDIAKATKTVISQVEGLFAAGSDENVYTDNDGRTYRLDQAQHRTGTDQRDNINTGMKNDIVFGGLGDDRISTLSGNDQLFGGPGRNVLIAGPGDDLLEDGDGDGQLVGDAGDDTFRPGKGSNFIDGGFGRDTIEFSGRDFGRNVLLDPTRDGVIRFTDLSISELVFRKDRYDLLIEAKSFSATPPSALRFSRYFENDAGGWEIVDKFANHYNLYALTGRVSTYEALQIAFRDRDASGTPVYPAQIQPTTVLHDVTGRFTIHIAEDKRLQTDNTSPEHRGLVLTFEGDNSLTDWLTRNSMAALPAAVGIIPRIMSNVDLSVYDAITIIGIGEGGLIAQWFAAVAATKGPSIVYSHLINTPDISGMVSQVVSSDAQQVIDGTTQTLATGRPEYADGFSVQHNNFLVNSRDWISRFGLWSGNNEIYATWKAYEFESQTATGKIIPDLAEVQNWHAPRGTGIDFSSLRTTDMSLGQVRGVVSFTGLDEMRQAFANVPIIVGGQVYDSTIDARNVMSNDVVPTLDIAEGSAAIRADFLRWLQPDASAAESSNPFVMRFDFQAATQRGDQLADGHLAVTEATLYNPQITAPRKYGWESAVGVSAGADRGRASALERDSLKVSEGTFVIDLQGPGGGPGTYNISITVGDREDLQESLQIAIDGFQADRVSTMPGDFLTRTFQIHTTSAQLRIAFTDLGGKHAATSINGISIEKVNYRAPIPDTETLQSDPALTVVIPSYELPESNAAIEIFKQALIAAATAAVTAGIGAALSTTSWGASIPAGLGGSFEAGLKGALKIKDSLSFMTVMQSVVGPEALKAAGMSLVTSLPQNLIPSPTARGIFGGALSIFMVNGPLAPKSDATGVLRVLENVHKGLDTLNGALAIAGTAVAAARGQLDGPTVAPWVYEVISSLGTMTQQFRLGRSDTAFVPVELTTIEQAIDSGKSLDQIYKLWPGSKDFLVLNWVPEKTLTQISVSEQIQYTKRAARVLKKLIEAYSNQLQVQQPQAKFDLLQISHGAGYEISRELTRRLNNSEVADALDFVQLVTLDPYASSAEALAWYHPEFTVIVDRVVNLYQVEKDNSPLYHGGSNLGGLDGREGGNAYGMRNDAASFYSLSTKQELLRVRNYDENTAQLAHAELTDIRFSPDGSLVAISDKNGNVSVRYTQDIPKPGGTTGELQSRAGDQIFNVWGDEQLVRSVAFVQIEHEGVFKDYLLTISAARDPANTNPNKNKIVLTDLQNRMPVWQGTDIGGTQVAASPSGNLLVSTDSAGHAKVWKRVAGTVTFEPLPDLVDAHTNADRNYVADVVVLNDQYFVTAGLDGRAKLFVIDDNNVRLAQPALSFDDASEGEVRNLAYDPYNGILAIAAGETTSLWRFDQTSGRLMAWGSGAASGNRFVMHDHVGNVQGLAFKKPAFLLNADGKYLGDRQITLANGTQVSLPRTAAGDINQDALKQLLQSLGLPTALKGLKLITGGEDRTVFSYSLDNLHLNSVTYDLVLSGNTLPIRELDVSSDGQTLALVGIDNINGDYGGPTDDLNVTGRLDSRLGWQFSEIFLQGRREYNAITQEYVYSVVEEDGEAFFWLRNSNNANRPGSLDKARNLTVPFNKQNRLPGVDMAPLNLAIRPGETIEIKPLQYLLEADREKFAIDQATLTLGEIRDASGVLLGSLKQKRVNGQNLPNILVFTASDDLDYSASQRTEHVAQVKLDIDGPKDMEGNARRIEGAPLTIRIINNKPIAYRDVVDLYPSGKIVDLRPRANDYDPDDDTLVMVPFSGIWQAITFNSEAVARVRANPNQPAGIDIEPLIDESRLATILQSLGSGTEYVALTIPYTVREQVYSAAGSGVVEVRLRLPSGPENVRYSDLGADRVTLHWDIVSWAANRYEIEHYDAQLGWRPHSNQSFVLGRTTDSITIKIVPESTNWFRVVAVNTNTDRRQASYEGNDQGGLFVLAPDYVGPESVVMETLSATAIEVRWDKVYWSVERYAVVLRELIVGPDGHLLKDANGQYSFVSSTVRTKFVAEGDGLSHRFTQLKAGTPYLAIVVARNDSLDVAEATYALEPVFTEQRLLPGAIQLDRVGPVAVRVSWDTVGYADKYRIVLVDPITLERVRVENFAADTNRSRQSEVLLDIPKPDKSLANEWAIFVEAKKGEQWLGLMRQPIVLPLAPPEPNQSQITLVAGAAPSFVLPADFNVPLRLPSLSGQIEGAEFLLMNFSRNSVRVVPFAAGEQVSFDSYYAGEQILLPAFGQQTSFGAVAYRLETVVDSATGTLRWSISTGETGSQAIRVLTPPYLAAEAGSLQADPRPYRMTVQFTSPFWNVTRHKLDILFPQVINGLTFWLEAAPSKTFWTEDSASSNYQHTFTGLTPNTSYLIRLTTSGPAGTYYSTLVQSTEDLQSPIDPDFSEVTLRSFKATWTQVPWAQNYRVVLEQKLSGQWTPIRVNEPSLRVGSSASQLTVGDLDMGGEYRFTVEARSGDPDAQAINGGWIANPVVKVVKTRQFLLPDGVFLVASERKTRQLKIDWTAVFEKADSNGFLFGADRWKVWWKVAGSTDQPVASEWFTGSQTQSVIAGLKSNTNYEIWVEFQAGVGQSLRLNTENNSPIATRPHQPANQVTVIEAETLRHGFTVQWKHDDRVDVNTFTVLVSTNMVNWFAVGRVRNDGTVEDSINLSNQRAQFEVDRIRDANGNWDRPTSDTLYYLKVRATFDDIAPLDSDPPFSVRTLPYPTPTQVAGTAASTRAIDLTWSHETQIGNPDRFVIVQSKDNVTWNDLSIAVTGSERTKRVQGLEPGARYWFKIRAEYSLAERLSSSSPDIWTLNPVLQITNVRVDGKKALTVFWSSLDGWEPATMQIKVQKINVFGQPNGAWYVPEGGNITDDKSRTSKQITGLSIGTTYNVQLVFVNTLGIEFKSAVVQQTTEAMAPITGLNTFDHRGSSVNLQWQRLETIEPNANVTRNQVDVFLNGSLFKTFNTGTGQGPNHSVEATGLSLGVTYQFMVTAFDGTERLSNSALHTFTTFTDAKDVKVAPIAWRKLQVSWTPPTWTVAEYVVKLFEVGSTSVYDTRNPSGASTWVNFGDLPINRAFYATVTAINTALKVNGVVSSPSAAASTYARTTPVLTSISQSGSTLKFDWNHFAPPEIGNELRYRIERRTIGGNWNTVKGGIVPTEGQSNQTYSIARQAATPPIGLGVYQFRVVAVYADAPDFNSDFVPFTVR